MRLHRLLTPVVIVLTLPAAIFICRGRTIEMPRRQTSEAVLIASRLKARASLQARRHENLLSLRLHRHAEYSGRQRA